MKNRLRNILLPAFVLITAATLYSCKHEFSGDEPLPPVHTPSVFVGNNNKMVYSTDLETGKVKWKLAVEGEVHATPVLFADALWVGTDKGNLYKINKFTGEIIAQVAYKNEAIEATPVSHNGNLVVPAGKKVHYIDVNSLADIWVYDAQSDIIASPTVHDIDGGEPSAIFIASMGGKITALDNNGGAIWNFSVSGSFYSSPCVVNNDFMYIGNDNGNLYCINTTDGKMKWAFQTKGMVRSSPINVGGNVMVGSNDRTFYSVDSASGELRWKVETTDQIISSPVVDNQYVYFAGFDSYVYCVDIINGDIKWKMKSFGLIKSSPTVYGGAVLIGSYDKNLYKLDTADGSAYWVRNLNAQIQSSAVIDTMGSTGIVPSISGEYLY